MDSLKLLVLVFLVQSEVFVLRSAGGPVAVEFVYPNFRASNVRFVDAAGVFLRSPSGFFSAVIDSPQPQQPGNFYFSVVHAASNSIVWSANGGAPVTHSDELLLSPAGLSLTTVWSTPKLPGVVSAMRLDDAGNLMLLNPANSSLWQSFDHPTDTFVSGQALRVGGASLTSFSSLSNLTAADYRLVPTSGDLKLVWNRGDQKYWSMSSDARAVKNSNKEASVLSMNSSGLFLAGGGGEVVWQTTTLAPAALRIAKLAANGQLKISSFASPNSSSPSDVFLAPAKSCDLPLPCAAVAVCAAEGQTSCSCPPGFSTGDAGCSPSDGSVLPLSPSSSSCNERSSSSVANYVSVGQGIDYFARAFSSPESLGLGLEACRNLCSQNCSCVGFFLKNSIGACFLLEKPLGSFRTGGAADLGLFLKAIPPPPGTSPRREKSSPAYILPILLPAVSVLLLVLLVGILLCRIRHRRRQARSRYSIKLGRFKSWPSPSPEKVKDSGEDSGDDDDVSIPGLPARFSYEELQIATDGFSTRIGAGAFGEVFKGVLPDGTAIAVKQIGNLGLRGKREFCTEIAVIGNIHHVNLVKLRGFCVQGRRRLLVYEYMSRSSLDRSLFSAPPLEWAERVEIALGAARGLAYLHYGCDQKIIHCDVKPENILLNHLGQVKIADFGMAKLLDQGQSAFFTTLRGTRGYLAPEWLTNSSISDKSDVYSFGMVLLELVRGRKNSELDSGAGESGYFPMSALEMHEKRRYLELADPRLEGRVREEEVEKLVRVALCCLQEEPASRPTMVTVVGMLEGTMPLRSPRSESLNFLRFYARNASVTAPGELPAAGLFDPGEFTTATASTSVSYLSAQQLSGPR